MMMMTFRSRKTFPFLFSFFVGTFLGVAFLTPLAHATTIILHPTKVSGSPSNWTTQNGGDASCVSGNTATAWACLNDQPVNAGTGSSVTANDSDYIMSAGNNLTSTIDFRFPAGMIPAGSTVSQIYVATRAYTTSANFTSYKVSISPDGGAFAANSNSGNSTRSSFGWWDFSNDFVSGSWSSSQLDNMFVRIQAPASSPELGQILISQMYATITYTSPSFGYSLSNSGGIAVTRGFSGSNTITATLSSGTTQTVSYSASGLPSGATASFSPTSCNPTCSTTLTIATTAATLAGSYIITVTGTPAPLSPTTFTLTVTADTTPPTPPTVSFGNPWSGSVNLTLTGPSGSQTFAALPTTPNPLTGQTVGSYTLVYNSGGPGSGLTLKSITPSATQTLPAGGNITFTLNFAITALPDLTAGPVSPTSATAGTAATFSATVSNTGNGSTGTGFTNLFQRATASDGTGASDIGTSVQSTALSAGATATASLSYATSTAGTFYMRVCADKSSAGDTGTIPEWNGSGTGETNNCGAWTAVTVTLPVLTGTFSAGPDTIDPGKPSTLTWTSNATTCTGTGFSTGTLSPANGSATVSPTTPGPNAYQITCTKSGYAPLILATTVTVIQVTASISAKPTCLSGGGSSKISWSATPSNLRCNVSSVPATPLGPSGPGISSTQLTGVNVPVTVTAKSTYTIACTTTGGASVTKSAVVDVRSCWTEF